MKFFFYFPNTTYYRFIYGNAVVSKAVTYIYGFGPTLSYLQFIFRLTTYIHRHYQLFDINFWNKYITPEIDKKEEVCFIFTGMVLGRVWPGYIDYLKSNYNCKIVLMLTDNATTYLSHGYDLEYYREKMDVICTYNEKDAELYGFKVHEPLTFTLSNATNLPFIQRPIDVFFIGQEKGRGDTISDLYEKCKKLGLNCEFHVIGETNRVYSNGIMVSQAPWAYPDILKKVGQSKMLVNILQPGSSGVTVRDIEAYNYGCCLLSNCVSDKNSIYFHEDQIIDINSIDFDFKIHKVMDKKDCFKRKECKFGLDYFFDWVEYTLKTRV